jgi:hypothetical protein
MPNMELSAIWGELPGDLSEKILSQVVDMHFHRDPAYTWTKLRHTSAHQKRVIEHRFGQFWLPKLTITLYAGALHKFEYALDEEGGSSSPDAAGETATFAVQLHIYRPIAFAIQESVPGKQTHKYLRDAWASYDPATRRNLTVRLGEGYLGGGCRGGYIVNDTDLPGLQILEDAKIRFRWKEAINELLREEMYLRTVGKKMVRPIPVCLFKPRDGPSPNRPDASSPTPTASGVPATPSQALRPTETSTSRSGAATSSSPAAWPPSSTAQPSPSNRPGRFASSSRPSPSGYTTRSRIPRVPRYSTT